MEKTKDFTEGKILPQLLSFAFFCALWQTLAQFHQLLFLLRFVLLRCSFLL